MTIQNRMNEIVLLRSHICQDFLRMILCDNWQENLFNFVDSIMKSNYSYKQNYTNAYNKMCEKGYTNYSVEDMDVSFIYIVVQFTPVIKTIGNNTRKSLKAIKDDRNINDHSDNNESSVVLFERCHVALRDLQLFVEDININEVVSLNESDRLNFVQKYHDEIESMKKAIDNEYLPLIQWHREVENDIQTLKESENPYKAWIHVREKYFKRYFTPDQYKEKYYPFIVACSDAGIVYAHFESAEYYESISNSEEAEQRLQLLYNANELTESDINNINNTIQLKTIRKEEVSDGIKNLINKAKEQGYSLEQSKVNGIPILCKKSIEK